MLLPMRFIDLFCGMGLASRGLMNAGLTPVYGVDSDYWATQTYRRNIAPVVNENLMQDAPSLPERHRLSNIGLVWASPPGAPAHRHEDGSVTHDPVSEAIAFQTLRHALSYKPDYIVFEHKLGVIDRRGRERMAEVADGYEAPTMLTIDPYLHAGGPAARARSYHVWRKRGLPRPPIEMNKASEPASDARAAISPGIALKADFSGLSSWRRRFIEEAMSMRYGAAVNFTSARGRTHQRTPPNVTSLGLSHPEIVERMQIYYATPEGWREADIPDFRRALGVPDRYRIEGVRLVQSKQLSNATDVRAAALIGRSLLRQ